MNYICLKFAKLSPIFCKACVQNNRCIGGLCRTIGIGQESRGMNGCRRERIALHGRIGRNLRGQYLRKRGRKLRVEACLEGVPKVQHGVGEKSHLNLQLSNKRIMNHLLVDLLRQSSSMSLDPRIKRSLLVAHSPSPSHSQHQNARRLHHLRYPNSR